MKKILIIQNKRIGDVLIASIIPNNLKKIYPQSHITFFCYGYAAPVLYNNPNVDEIITVSNSELKKFKKLVEISKQFRNANFDLIVDPYVKTQSQFISLFSGCKERIAFKKKVLPFSYTKQVPFLKKRVSDYGKAIDDRLNLLQSINSETNLDPYPKLFLTENEKEEGKNILDYHDVDASRPTIMLGVLGSNPTKSLPLSYVSKIIDELTKYDINILFNYIPAQKPLVDEIYNGVKNKDNIYPDVIGKDIREFIKIMNACDLLIANEGGTVHIAKALQKRTFTIYSPYVDKANWATFEDNDRHLSVHLKELKPELFVDKTGKDIKNTSETLYQEFTPELISPTMHVFIKNHLS